MVLERVNTSSKGAAEAPTRGRLTWMMLVPFLKLVKDLMTSWLMASTDCFQLEEKPRTSWVIRAVDRQEVRQTDRKCAEPG